MPHQVAVTIRAAVRPGRLPGLREVLTAMADDPAANDVLPFAELPGLHFARVVVVDEQTSPLLFLMLDCDAPERRLLRALSQHEGLDRLLGCCQGYPAVARPSGRARFLRSHRQRSAVVYVHDVGRTVQQVRLEARLRAALEDSLDEGGPVERSCREVRERLRREVASRPDLTEALDRPARPALRFRLREAAHRVAVPAALLVLLPVVLPALVLWFLALRRHERRDPAARVPLDPARLRALGDAEDYGVQNAFTSIAPVKPGRFWSVSCSMSIAVGDYVARHVFNHQGLSGLRTVHFARFDRVGDRMLFTSYYDGSLESYNNDFVDQIAWVLNTVFGVEEGFPRTRWLVRDGAHDEVGFKAFIRGHQIETPVWWSAYPELAAVTVDENAAIRAGLRGPMTEQEAARWLARL
ncbi:hypothetical protein CLV35_0757 [Motilibacter peucedani]|uniref:Uncharacterized protein n=1 Tax=Motilibacter peucedani TaxID=598650 RepID=A0A420XUK0_9ACTN|nr:hypothetical protein [Motilibacter peucedani]RKS80329.1 hypothetical protein CLV35_0757 [Motilibacter peucedani]